MSESLDKTSCISHRPNTHFFVMYEDFLDVAKISEHQHKLAAFWRVLETKTNERQIQNDCNIKDARDRGLPIPETSMWIEITYSEFSKRTLGVYKESSFKIAAAESERLGFSKSRVKKRPSNPLDPKSKGTDYKEYLFLPDVMQRAMDQGIYPTPVDFDSPLLKGYNERKTKNTPVDFNPPPVEINRTGVKNDSTPVEIDQLNNIVIESNSITENKKTTKSNAVASQPSTTSRKSVSAKKVAEKKPEPPKQPEPDLSHLSEAELIVYQSLTLKHRPWYLKFDENGRHNYGVWLQKYKETTYVALGAATVDTLNAIRKLSLEHLLEIEKLAYELDGEYLRKHGGFQIHNIMSYLGKWQTLRERQQSSGQINPDNKQNETTQEDENKLVAWTRAGKYEGDPEKNWQQFELMPIKEAKLHGWQKGVFPGVVHNHIMIQLKKQAAEKRRVSA